MGPVEPRDDHDVSYVTDVEGQWERLASFLQDNPHVALEDGRIVVRHGATFVFGGDAIDRGAHARRIVRLLLDAKTRQPEQVVLLGGNRDLNKMRLVTELAGEPPRRTPDDVKSGPRPELLRWIFTNTMGAAGAFDFRRDELRSEGLPDDDDNVVASFAADLAPEGELTRYLGECQLAWRSGRTLFVHGGVAEEALCVIPGEPTGTLEAFDVDAWIARLNKFYRWSLAAYRGRELRADGSPGWEDAVLYQAPRKGMRSNPGSVVYGRFGDEHNNPALPEQAVIDALSRCGITRVVVGHTPNGDVASVVRCTTSAAPFEIAIADNSRSRVGTACRLHLRDAALRMQGQLVLDDERALAVDATLPIDDRSGPLGRRTADGSLVKAPVEGGFHVFKYLPGYVVSQRVLAADALGPLEDAARPVDEAGGEGHRGSGRD